MNSFSEKIKGILSQKGITPYRLSQISGIRQSTLSAILNGVNKPSGKTLQKICNALDISMAEFDDKPTDKPDVKQQAATELLQHIISEDKSLAVLDGNPEVIKILSLFIEEPTVQDGKLKYKLTANTKLLETIEKLKSLSPEKRKAAELVIDLFADYHP